MPRSRMQHPFASPGEKAAWSRVWLAAFLCTMLTLTGCGTKNVLAPEPSSMSAATFLTDSTSGLECRTRPVSDGPIHLEGETGPGALWVIDKPAEWNGDLVVYLHGYTDPAQPVALPNNGPIRDALLARGFAVAASSYSANGYAVKEGTRQSRQLSQIFSSRLRRPRHTFLLGQSLGGLIGLILTQQFPGQYDGSLLVCGVVGGSDDEVQYLGDIRVLFDAAYPGVLGGDLEHPPVITNLNTQVIGPVTQAVQANPQGLGIIQALARRPLPGNNGQEIVTSLLNVLIFGLQGGGDLLERTHGHSYFDNASWHYTSPALPTAVIDDVNARVARYRATPDARAYLFRYGEPSGRIEIPTISLHTTRDPVVPVFHEDLLAQVTSSPWLLQRRVDRYGHCNFTVDELMTNFDDVVAWAAVGHKPVI